MGHFLDWYALHNTLIIKSIAALLFLIIIVFIYRLFFLKSNDESDAKSPGGLAYRQLEEKLNKLLEQQEVVQATIMTNMGTAKADDTLTANKLSAEALAAITGDDGGINSGDLSPEATAIGTDAIISGAGAAAGTNAAQAEELKKLREEIVVLKESVKQKEAEAVAAKNNIVAGGSAGANASSEQLDDLNSKISEYENEIDILKKRLSDYEIIAEDIAELQKFKKENESLKKQLASSGAADTSLADANLVDADTEMLSSTEDISDANTASEEMPELTTDDEDMSEEDLLSASLPQTTDESLTDIEDITLESLGLKLDSDDTESESLPELTSDDNPSLETDEARELARDVSEDEKKTLDDFEKIFLKVDD